MKKISLFLIVAMVALASFAATIDLSDGGTGSPGASAMSKSLVFSKTFDFAVAEPDTGDVVQLFNVPAGVVPLFAVVTPDGVNQSITNTVMSKTGTNAFSAAASANVLTKSALVPVMSWLSFPTVSAAGPQSTNLTVTVGTTATKSLDLVTYGVKVDASTTNGMPTAGTLTLSVTAFDVAPIIR